MVNKDYTHLLLVADRSGSMRSIEKDMNGGIESLLKEQAQLPGFLKVDIVTFDSEIETSYAGVSVSEIEFPVIHPRGATALLDAIGEGVTSLGKRLAALPEDERPGKVLAVIVTDGAENASRNYSNAQIKQIIETQQGVYNWEFVFLGANVDSFSVAGAWGISRDSTLTYTTTSAGVNHTVSSLSNYMTVSRSGATAGFTDEDRDAASSS